MSPRKLAGGSSKRLILEILLLIASPKIHVFRFLPLPPFSFTIEGTLFFFQPEQSSRGGAGWGIRRKLRCCRRHSVQTSSMSSCNGGCTSLGCLSDLCRRRSFICSWSNPLVGLVGARASCCFSSARQVPVRGAHRLCWPVPSRIALGVS